MPGYFIDRPALLAQAREALAQAEPGVGPGGSPGMDLEMDLGVGQRIAASADQSPRCFKGYEHKVKSVAVSPDGRTTLLSPVTFGQSAVREPLIVVGDDDSAAHFLDFYGPAA